MIRQILPLLMAILVPPLATLVLASILVIGETDVAFTSAPRDGASGLGGPDEMQSRLATSIAFRAGLIRLATEDETEQLRKANPDGQFPGPVWLGVTAGSGCARDPAVMAILATESYLRPAFVRRSERIAAEIVAGLTGHWPDWSYGPAQLRPSTAERILALAGRRLARIGPVPDLTPDRAELVSALMDGCASAALVDLSLLVAAEAGDGPQEHALRHLGGKRIPTMPGVIEYTGIVARVTNVMLRAERTSHELFGLDEEQYSEDPGVHQVEPPRLPEDMTAWAEPVPSHCVRDTGSGIELLPVTGAPSNPSTNGLLVDGGSDFLWSLEATTEWTAVSRLLAFHRDVAQAAGLNPDRLRLARPGDYLRAEAMLHVSPCSALLLRPEP